MTVEQGSVKKQDLTDIEDAITVHAPLSDYKFSDIDDSDTSYFGFVKTDGSWYILQLSSTGTGRYYAGSSNYTTNWTGRAALSYDYYYNIF